MWGKNSLHEALTVWVGCVAVVMGMGDAPTVDSVLPTIVFTEFVTNITIHGHGRACHLSNLASVSSLLKLYYAHHAQMIHTGRPAGKLAR